MFSVDLVPDYRSLKWKQYELMCSIAEFAKRGARVHAGLEYRGYSLCNSADLDETAFTRASSQFKTYVDNDVWAQRVQIASHIGTALTWGTVVWTIMMLVTLSATWISRGQSS